MSEPTKPTKLCMYCKHAKIGWFDWLFLGGYRFAKCTHPALNREAIYSPVNGEKIAGEEYYCSVMRRYDCGDEGKYYESNNNSLQNRDTGTR